MSYCSENNINFVEPHIGQVLDFLYMHYNSGLAYSTMSAIRSALSAIIKIDGKPVGQHAYVTQLIRSVYQERPNLAKYDVV